MPIRENQYIPDDNELVAFKDQILYPKLIEIENELGNEINLRIIACALGKEVELTSTQSNNGTCKVCFFSTFKEHRKIIYVSVRLDEKEPNSGFSGFNLKGEISQGAAKTRGYTIVYNDQSFPSW